ncbi:hypothetical protein [uncultured Sphaerochaeta sp.]|uniref:hypothetical protein n=1 Tax=uncultured Sphaerochaeta sp. TaxID=886478 RepID=UPI002A0A6A50|nr:hypothetical protein [uncultured Sphaerochaeta sp.]
MDISATGSVGTQDRGSKRYFRLLNTEIQAIVSNKIASKGQFLPAKEGKGISVPLDIAKDFNIIQAIFACLHDIRLVHPTEASQLSNIT